MAEGHCFLPLLIDRPPVGIVRGQKGEHMTREEKKSELRVIADHLNNVDCDLIDYIHRLEEIGCKREAKLLDTIAGKLYNLVWVLTDKGR